MTRSRRDPLALTPFRWLRPVDGVRVAEVHGQEDDLGRRKALPAPELVIAEGHGFEDRRVEVYEPLREVPDLAVRLANLPDSPEALAAFASSYGFLGDIWGDADRIGGPSELHPDSTGHSDTGPGPPAIRGRGLPRQGWHRCAFELVDDWRIVTRQLRQVLELLTALKANDRDRVEELVSLGEHGAAMQPWEVDFARLEAEGLGAPLRAGRRLVFAGWCLLQQAVNFELERATRTALVWEKPQRRGDPVLVPRTVVRNLNGAAWLQVAHSFAAACPVRQCGAPNCRALIYVSPGARGKRHTYCNEAHRSAAYRARREQARELFAKGLKPSAIARRIARTTPQQVAVWVGLQPAPKGK